MESAEVGRLEGSQSKVTGIKGVPFAEIPAFQGQDCRFVPRVQISVTTCIALGGVTFLHRLSQALPRGLTVYVVSCNNVHLNAFGTFVNVRKLSAGPGSLSPKVHEK